VRRHLTGAAGRAVALALALPVGAAAQTSPHGLHWGARAIGVFTEARPAVAGRTLREAYLTQPMLHADARSGALAGRVILNFERWTLRRGELNAGTAGEGYVDRRHPHTVLHEAVVTAGLARGRVAGSITAGRGFVPFGTDDPMVRPFVKYPANHHHAQILERWVAVGALAARAFTLEAGVFNGDEPAGPASLGRLARFGDSYAIRLTARPVRGIELQASGADVASPENPGGGGLDQTKWSASARLARDIGGRPVYGLAEWARTHELRQGRRAFAYASALAELMAPLGAARVALRVERTSRAEEERLADPFRSARPHNDDNVLGITRWTIGTLAVDGAVRRGSFLAAPFVEISRLQVTELTGSIFDPAEFYGSTAHWSLSLGVRLGAGAAHGRAGRYGAALPAGRGAGHDATGRHDDHD
jgi:hypothetical protein